MESLLSKVKKAIKKSSKEPNRFLPPALRLLIKLAAVIIAANEAKKIVILGSKGSGKTTLWDKLRGKEISDNYSATGKEVIEKFKIKKKDGSYVKIEATKDIGGDDLWVPYYEDLIEDETFIFFLVDLTTVKDKKKEIRARLYKIDDIVEKKGFKKHGISILATFYDKYKQECTEEPNTYLRNVLELDNKYEFIPIDLLNPNDIEKIKEKIGIDNWMVGENIMEEEYIII